MPSAQKKLAKHWDRLTRDEIKKAQGIVLQEYLNDQVAPFSGFYGKLWKEHGVKIGKVRSIEDLQQLPFTSKKNLTATDDGQSPAKEFVLQPDEKILSKRRSTIIKAILKGKKRVKEDFEKEYRPILMTSTTGRSSEPVPFFYTQHDIENLKTTGYRMMEISGAKNDFRHVNLFPFAPHLAFWQMHYAGIARNVFNLSTGGGKTMGTSGNVMMLNKIKPDALIGMPTFVNHVLREAVDDGIKGLNIKKIVLGGEKVPDGTKRRLRELCRKLGTKEPTAIAATYGFTEAKMAFSENTTVPGIESTGYRICPDLGVVEIVDPETGEQLPDGTPGEIVYTPLNSRGSVVVRYRTGDLIDGGLFYDECPHTGSRSPKLVGKISRVSDFKRLSIGKVKGNLVNFNELEHILDDIDGIAAWQIELRKKEDDPLLPDLLYVHATEEPGVDQGHLETEMAERMISSVEMRPNGVFWHDLATLQKKQGVGDELKEQKIVDNRVE